jgi:DNA-binding FrmR family transcriptional regulator
MTRISTQKNKALHVAKQARGMIDKVIALIEADEYCPNIIQQADSVSGFMTSVKRELLAGHLDSCLMNRIKENKEQTIKELMKIYNLSEG